MHNEVKANSDVLAGGNATEALMQAIAASGAGMLAVIDKNSYKVIYANQQFYDNFGYTQEEIQEEGFSFLSLLDDDAQHERLKTQLREVSVNIESRKKYVVYRLKYKHKAPESVYLYASPLVVSDERYRDCYHINMFPDLSKWPLPFTSFYTREIFLEQFNKEGFGTFEWIIAADKVFWSDGVYKMYGLEKNSKDISYAFIKQFTHPDDSEMTSEAVRMAVENGGNVDIQFKIITGKHNLKFLHFLGNTIQDSEGKVVKLVGSIRDVTSQYMVDEGLKKNVEELNRSNRELEEFAYIASHDLQEPLRKITTFSDRLRDKYADKLTGEGEMYLERMMASAENMRILINNLLEFSRVTKSTQPFAAVNLNFVLHQVKADLELIIEETGTSISSSALPVIEASVTQMKQLFTNIINNAIKFRKADIKPHIQIEASVVSKNDKTHYGLLHDLNYHKIEITDNGIGFEDEYAIRIFQIFQRLHGKSEYPGSGIGLAICKKIIEHHQGLIYAENISGGARFTFILPEKQTERFT